MSAVAWLRRQVCDAASSFDASGLGSDAAATAVREWSTISHAADAAMALAAARVGGVRSAGVGGRDDACELVAKTTGVTGAQAKSAITRGRGLAHHDKTRAAATQGELSPAQASAITDAVAVNAGVETELLDEAQRFVGGRVASAVRGEEGREPGPGCDRETHSFPPVPASLARRRGAEHLHATGTKRDMAVVDQALKRATDDVFTAARRDGVREPLDAYAFDALVATGRTADRRQRQRAAPARPDPEPGRAPPRSRSARPRPRPCRRVL